MSDARFFAINGESMSEVKPTPIPESELDLERHAKTCPSFLGENLLIIAEQLDFPHIKGDAIDLVGLAADGTVVVVELKKGKSPSDVDFQAIKYASYISHLDSNRLGEIAATFLARPENRGIREQVGALGVEVADEIDLAQLLAAWFKRDASEYDNTINDRQRILIVAEEFDARIALVVDWLSRQGVNIAGIQYQQVEFEGKRFLTSRRVFPATKLASEFVPSVRPGLVQEWKTDGRKWHMQRIRPEVGEALDRLIEALGEHITEISWEQAYYIWLRGKARNLRPHTYVRSRLDIGLHPASEEEAKAFLALHAHLGLVPKVVAGYQNSPFVRPELGPGFPSEGLVRMFAHWLDGQSAEEGGT